MGFLVGRVAYQIYVVSKGLVGGGAVGDNIFGKLAGRTSNWCRKRL